ncbi:MAG: HEAT repeat domain-containing protein [Acidobacteriales bacterium]|nr:HEAT repeat domain-containing protein [Terriglobales bacterium]
MSATPRIQVILLVTLGFAFLLPATLHCLDQSSSNADAWSILETAAQSQKVEDRVIGIRVLGLLPADQKASSLAVKALDDTRAEVRASAATALGQMNFTAAIPNLKKALSDSDVSVALAASHALNLMQDEYGYEVYYAVLTGQRKSSKGLIASQMETLRDPKKMARLGFSEGIGYVPFAGIGWEAFRNIRRDDSSPMRAAAATVLAADTDPKSAAALVAAISDKSWVVRVAALEALAKRKDPSALPKIEPSMQDSRREVRYTAAAVVLRLRAVQEAREAK